MAPSKAGRGDMITSGDRDLIVFVAIAVIITLLVLAALYVALKPRD